MTGEKPRSGSPWQASEGRSISGRAIALTFAGILAVATILFVLYKVQEGAQDPLSMRFTRQAEAGNLTVHELEYRAVHSSFHLEHHLDRALEDGGSLETVRLRVEIMHDTLVGLTGSQGPTWWVKWQGVVVHVELAAE